LLKLRGSSLNLFFPPRFSKADRDAKSMLNSIKAHFWVRNPTWKVWRSMGSSDERFKDTVKNLLRMKPKPHQEAPVPQDESQSDSDGGSERKARPKRLKD
jgi:hypothetical protein